MAEQPRIDRSDERNMNMNNIKDQLETYKNDNDILTPEMLESMDQAQEYIKDNDIYCKTCHEQRTLFAISRKVRTRCRCQREKLEAHRELELRAERMRHVEKLRTQSLLGQRYKSATFDKTDIADPDFEKIHARCSKYCDVAKQVLDQGIGIYLYGPKGTGKTHLTACIANELMAKYYSVIYTNFTEISKQIRSSFGSRTESEADFLSKLANVDFLFIDDFGTEMVAKDGEDLWLQEKIFEVVNKRYNASKPIIFTSNYSLVEMIKTRGLAEKTVDRISEMCETMKLEGKSYRMKAKSQREKLF